MTAHIPENTYKATARQPWTPIDYGVVWRMYFEEGLTQAEIARRLGTQQAYISRIVMKSPRRQKAPLARRYNKASCGCP